MKPFRILLVSLIAAGLALFAVRHRELKKLEGQRDQLRRETDEVASLESSVTRMQTRVEPSTNTGLSADERAELLRLRGQVGPLRRDLAQATNQLGRIARSPRPPSAGVSAEPTVSREEIARKMSRSRQWLIGVIIQADGTGRLPQTLGEVPQSEGIGSPDEFDFLHGGVSLTSIRSPSTTFILREKEPWKGPDGRWSRAYGFADGHVEIARSDTGDFTEWEAKHQPPESNAAGE
jgi:prepilin-type processing-associated H-X9-DG protein